MVLKLPGLLCLLGHLLFFSPCVKGSLTSACPDATGQEGALAMGQDNAAWFRPKAGGKGRDFTLQFKQGQETRYELQLKKRSNFLRVLLTERKGGQQTNIFDMARIPEDYFAEDSWASFRMSEEEVRLALRKNDLEGMETRLWGLQMESVDEVVTGSDVLAWTKCSPVIDPTTTTTPATTASSTSSGTEAWTGTSPPDEGTTGVEGGEGGSSDDPVLLEAAEDAAFGRRCIGGAPLWAWICACLLGLLVILLLVLAVYVVVLSGQNKRLKARLAKQGPASRLAPSASAGLGVQTSEVEFYQVRNPSLMVAAGTLSGSHSTPRFPGGHHAVYTPASQASKGRGSSSTPRLSAFRRSMSQPAPTEAGHRDPPTFEFPVPPATPPPGSSADEGEAEDYVNAETLMIDDSQRRGQAGHAEPFPRSVDSLLRELQFE